MTPFTTKIVIAAAATCLAAFSAQAQTPRPQSGDQLPPVGSPGDRTGSITSTGQTKPPGAAATGERPDLDRKSREMNERINRGICTGC